MKEKRCRYPRPKRRPRRKVPARLPARSPARTTISSSRSSLRAVGPVLHESLRRVESAVARELEGQTLADVIRGVRDRMEAPNPDA